MPHVSNNFSSSLDSNRKLKYFPVEVITFDGESYCEEAVIAKRFATAKNPAPQTRHRNL